MTLKASSIKGSSNRVAQDNIQPGNYSGRIQSVIDLGLQELEPYKGKEKAPANQLWISIELDGVYMKGEDGKENKDMPRRLSRKINLYSMSAENAMSTAYMLALDPAGALDGDWSRVGNTACTVTVVNRESKGVVYDNIGALSPVMRGMTVAELTSDPVFFDSDDPDLAVYNDLPEFLQNIIKDGLNYQGSKLEAMLGGNSEPTDAQLEEEAPY